MYAYVLSGGLGGWPPAPLLAMPLDRYGN